jgi:transcriptional regulator with XRE-family HTH domain
MQQKNNFRVNLKSLRLIRGKTQEQLADDLIINRATIGSYEEGRATPKLDTLIAMASYFNITVDELIK